MAKKEKDPVPAQAAPPTPLFDELQEVGARLMDSIEKQAEQLLLDNPAYAVLRFAQMIHVIGKLTVGEKDPNVRRLHELANSADLRAEILNNADLVKQRFVEGKGL